MRRDFVAASAMAGLAGAAQPVTPKDAYFHFLYYYMRNGPQVQRTTAYLSNAFLPAAQRAGAGPIGLFSPVIGDGSPNILALVTYPSFAAIETVQNRLLEDKDFQKGWEDYNAGEPPFIRMEGELLRAFETLPTAAAAADAKRRPRVFELRTYESPSEKTVRRKVGMFEQGEAAIFRKVGMATILFGQAVLVGRNLPKISYMLAYDDLAARDRLWSAFSADPEWQKLRAQPGLSDPEIVSGITNAILRPLAASQIR